MWLYNNVSSLYLDTFSNRWLDSISIYLCSMYPFFGSKFVQKVSFSSWFFEFLEKITKNRVNTVETRFHQKRILRNSKNYNYKKLKIYTEDVN